MHTLNSGTFTPFLDDEEKPKATFIVQKKNRFDLYNDRVLMLTTQRVISIQKWDKQMNSTNSTQKSKEIFHAKILYQMRQSKRQNKETSSRETSK